MSEAKSNQVVFVVVDRAGNNHWVTADRMLVEGREVTFFVDCRVIASFFDPQAAKVSAPDVCVPRAVELVQGEALSFTVDRRLFWPVMVLLALSALNSGFKAYELIAAAG